MILPPGPPPSHPSPLVHAPVICSYASNEDDDYIQEVVPIIKSEPLSTVAVEAPPSPSHTPGTVTHNMDDSYGDGGYESSGGRGRK